MRWIVFAVFAFVALALEMSLANVLSVANLVPSFVAVLVVYVAMFAPVATALWACWLLGLLVDLSTHLPNGSPALDAALIGPHALGYVFGCFVLLQLRSMVFRGRALTLAVMTVIFVVAATLVIVFLYAIHGWYPGEQLAWAELSAGWELLRRLGVAVYTGLLALVLARPLVWTTPLWSFRSMGQRDVAVAAPFAIRHRGSVIVIVILIRVS